MPKVSYSLRTGINPRLAGLELKTIRNLFTRLYAQLEDEGYTHEYFGFFCVDEPDGIKGKISDIEYTLLVTLRKERPLWPISCWAQNYSEDDLFDMIEFLFDRVSKPVDGHLHSYNQCGMHWKTFDRAAGQREFRKRINELLALYECRFELSPDGLILKLPPSGFEQLYEATVPTEDKTIEGRIEAAKTEYRRHGASLDTRRHAVADLAGVLEALRPKMGQAITSKDEADLFNIANNFAIRHHNDKQKTDYEASLWLSWMFYVYLSTIHLILRRLDSKKPKLNIASPPGRK
jgi:hypothetical protein